jgi:GNAT superfamily N-acetyltransferase
MTIVIRQMTRDDIPTGMRLKAQNGWNQVEEDWRRQLALQPDGCFVAEADGDIIGTACACIFDNVAWVNLVLVDKLHRGSGIGTSLMRYVLGFLEERRVPTVRLDATPLGRPIYENLGFVADHELTRFEGHMPYLGPASSRLAIAQDSDLDNIARLDLQITGTDRSKLIRYMHRRVDVYLVHDTGGLAGYAMFRPGYRAAQIGPCVGEDNACRQLVDGLSCVLKGHFIFMDVPTIQADAHHYIAGRGFTPQRTLTRMTRGRRVREQVDKLWCSFGPEKG